MTASDPTTPSAAMSKLSMQSSRHPKPSIAVSPTATKASLSQTFQPAQIPSGSITSRSHRSSSSASQRPEHSSFSSATNSPSVPSPSQFAGGHGSGSVVPGSSNARQTHHRKNSSSSIRSIKSLNHEYDFIPTPVRFPVAPSTGDIIDSFEREQEAIVNKLQKEIAHLKGSSARSRSRSTSSSSSVSRRPSTRSVYSLSDNEDHHIGSGLSVSNSHSIGKYPLSVPSPHSPGHHPAVTSSSSGPYGGGNGCNSTTNNICSTINSINNNGLVSVGSNQSVSNRSSRASFSSINSVSDDHSAQALQALRKENENLKKKLAELNSRLAEKDKEIEKLKG